MLGPFDVFPRLTTDRLILRKLLPEDLPALIRHVNHAEIAANVVNIPYPYGEPDAAFRLAFVQQGFAQQLRIVFALAKKDDNEIIGEAGIHFTKDSKAAELGYWMGPTFWSQGYTSEAVNAILDYGFRVHALDVVYAICKAENYASQKVAEKCKMQVFSRGDGMVRYIAKRIGSQ
jgi:ribosomal-protein-alanine N-acetyltransferase